MRKAKIEKLYEAHKNMIYSRALSFNRTSGHMVEDLVSVGNMKFMEAVESFDEAGKTEFGSWLYTVLTNGLSYYCKRIDVPDLDPDLEVIDHRSEWNPVSRLIWKETLQDLSEEAKEIVCILLSGPGELLDITGGEAPRMIRGKLKRHLLSQPHWSWGKVYDAFREIKQAI